MILSRIPFFATVAILIGVVTLAVTSGLLSLRQRSASEVRRGLYAAGVVLSILLSPALFVAVVEPRVVAARQHGQFIDPPYVLSLYSASAVIVLLVTFRLLFPATTRASTRLWRMLFAGVVFGFAAMNLANWCQPGWCGRFGFPFTYSWWSDAIVIVNGENWSAGWSTAALAGNGVVLLAIVAALAWYYRRVQRDPAPSNST